jgi:hypothetical protein
MADPTLRDQGMVYGHAWATRGSSEENLRMRDPIDMAVDLMRQWRDITVVQDNPQ